MTIIEYNREEVLKALPPLDANPHLPWVFINSFRTAVGLWDSRMGNGKWKTGFFEEVAHYSYFTMEELYIVMLVALFITTVRYLFTVLISVPLGRYLKLSKLNIRKFPESLWKFIFYAFSWSYCCYLVTSAGYNIFDDTRNCFNDFKRGMDVPTDFKMLYLMQGSFYVHSFYSTLYMDEQRKDTWMMIVHHIVANSLLLFSYSVRYYKIAALVIFTHDITDICLEFAKLNQYLKFRNGKTSKFFDFVSSFFFLFFAFLWMVFRLYLYPVKVLNTTGHTAAHIIPNGPFYYSINTLLWLLFGMNIYWFTFIATSLTKIALGWQKELRDSREDEMEEYIDREITKKQVMKGNDSENHVDNNSNTFNHNETVSKESDNSELRRRN